MSSSQLIPIIVWLPKGYDCSVVMPIEAIAARLPNGTGTIIRAWTVYRDGQPVGEGEDRIEVENGLTLGDPVAAVTWPGAGLDDWPMEGGYLEFAVRVADGAPLFASNRPPGFYNIFSAPGRKTFFLCHTWKFGSPQVIGQIAEFGRYIDTYPVIHIDRERDLGDSLMLIKPYHRPILAQILTYDGRRPRRLRVESMTGRMVDLAELIAPDEPRWMGQIQITANNRLITHIVKHSISDPTLISTVEHLDPFRADPTHFPLFRWLRLTIGQVLPARPWGRQKT